MIRRRILASILGVTLSMGLVVGGCGEPKTQETQSEVTEYSEETQELIDTLRDAYVFTFPLMIMDATSRKMTNSEEISYVQAPANEFSHSPALADASTGKDVARTNVDTLYSKAFLDLSQDAVIAEFPKTDRFCNAHIMDAYTNAVDILDFNTFEKDKQTYIFTGPSFEGQIPEGMIQIKSPTSLVWILVRAACYDVKDANNVRDIQAEIDMYTLEQYKNGTTEVDAKGTYSEEENFYPHEYVTSLSMEEYFNKANQLMIQNPPGEADAKAIQSFAPINVGPGLEFSSDIFGEDADKIYAEILSTVEESCRKASQKFLMENGCWDYYGDPIADFGTEYEFRNYIAYTALALNPTEVAIYLETYTDSQGETLNSANDYVIHIDADQMPEFKEGGFWSFTAYDINQRLIHNDWNRYNVNDRSKGLVYNADGSLDIYLSKEPPSQDKMANWISIDLEDEDFLVWLRIYTPEDNILANDWVAPTVTKVSK